MSTQSPHIQLGQLENKIRRKQISMDEYKQLKWELLVRVHEEVETVLPLTRGKKEVTDSMNANFCYISPGPFMFGEEEYGELKAAIYMAKYPVTVKNYLDFLEDSDWDYSDSDMQKMRAICPEEDCPVCHVSWEDAKEYCRWLRRKTGEYYSIPYEVEWEVAARGIDGRPYPWGYQEPNADLVCAQGDSEYENTMPVESFPLNKSPFGCIGMVGNVWEWCLDSFDDDRDPHLLRGGSWLHEYEYANCTSKIISFPPEKRVDYGGFRVIYLPKDMLVEYRKQMEAEGGQPGVQLKVISVAPEGIQVKFSEDKKKNKEPKTVEDTTDTGGSEVDNERSQEFVADSIDPVEEETESPEQTTSELMDENNHDAEPSKSKPVLKMFGKAPDSQPSEE